MPDNSLGSLATPVLVKFDINISIISLISSFSKLFNDLNVFCSDLLEMVAFVHVGKIMYNDTKGVLIN